jgi:hypothetical protein
MRTGIDLTEGNEGNEELNAGVCDTCGAVDLASVTSSFVSFCKNSFRTE